LYVTGVKSFWIADGLFISSVAQLSHS